MEKEDERAITLADCARADVAEIVASAVLLLVNRSRMPPAEPASRQERKASDA